MSSYSLIEKPFKKWHDIAYGKLYDSFSQLFRDLIGFSGKRAINIPQLKFYSKVQFNESS